MRAIHRTLLRGGKKEKQTFTHRLVCLKAIIKPILNRDPIGTAAVQLIVEVAIRSVIRR